MTTFTYRIEDGRHYRLPVPSKVPITWTQQWPIYICQADGRDVDWAPTPGMARDWCTEYAPEHYGKGTM